MFNRFGLGGGDESGKESTDDDNFNGDWGECFGIFPRESAVCFFIISGLVAASDVSVPRSDVGFVSGDDDWSICCLVL